MNQQHHLFTATLAGENVLRDGVAFPARQFAVNGERRSFALLRPLTDTGGQERVRDLVLQAYAEYEERTAIASDS